MIPFIKAHAYGNDFLYVELKTVEGRDAAVAARRLCDRHRGVGADGLIVEVHDQPEKALSDGAQALTPDQYEQLIQEVRPIREVVTPQAVA